VSTVITRREALRRAGALALGVAAWPLLGACSHATKPSRSARIGYLWPGTLEAGGGGSLRLAGFRKGMAEVGYSEGRDFTIELRVAEGKEDVLPQLAADLVALKVDVIVTATTVSIRAVKEATKNIPIVFATSGFPVEDGLVESIARPGGNATGLTITTGAVPTKRLDLLKEAYPSLSRVAYLWSSNSGSQPEFLLKQMENATVALRLQLLPLDVQVVDEVPAALTNAVVGGADGLTTQDINRFLIRAPQIVEFAAVHRLPAIYYDNSFVRAGGLMSYGADIPENFRRAATYVDKILKGANPGDIPIESPSKFEFVINLRAAEAIGLTFPRSVLQQATEVIS